MKNKEKDLKSFNEEIGIINIIDIEKILKPRKKAFSLPLSIEKNEEIYLTGLSSISKTKGNQDEIKENEEIKKSEEKKTNKKKKKKAKEEKKNEENNTNIKLCKKEK